MENTQKIIDDISSMYDEYYELDERMRTKITEYCNVLNEKYKDRIGKKLTTVRGGYCEKCTFFGGFMIDKFSYSCLCLCIIPILYYPTKEGLPSYKRVLTVRGDTFRTIKELDEKA
jgi:hypothetical protein